MDPNNPNLYTYCGNNPLVRIDPTGMLLKEIGNAIKNAVNSVVNAVASVFSGGSSSSGGSSGGGGSTPSSTNKPSSDKTSSQSPTSSEIPQTEQQTNYIDPSFIGDKPAWEPIGYQSFPGPPPVSFPVYRLDQLPESIQGNYINQIDPTDNTIMYIPPGMENAKISPHFTIREFASQVPALEADMVTLKLDQNDRAYSVGKDRFIRLDPRLIERLEKIRSDNGNLPMVIHEGYRSVVWHRALEHNGYETATYSPHTAGIGADFHIAGKNGRVSSVAIRSNVLGSMDGRIGINPTDNWVHYDIADTVYGPNYPVYKNGEPIYPYYTGCNWGYKK